MKNSTRIAVVLGVTALGLFFTASSALAGYARPKSANPLVFKIVPAFESCNGTGGQNHGAPLAFPSCPPVERSPWLTAKAPERAAPFLAAATSTGTIELKVTCVSSINPPVENGDTPPCNAGVGTDEADVKITSTATGVVCTVGTTGGQGSCAAGGPGGNYSGMVLGTSTIRITDRYNTITAGAACNTTAHPPSTAPGCDGTVFDLPFDVGSQCTNGNCSYTTSADATVPNVVKEQKRAVVELGQLTIQDAGQNGTLGPSPTSLCPPGCTQDDANWDTAGVQGLFIP